ncbi:metal-dependent hydrolase [Aquirhabdus sp.]|uniref:metal-dependent hydrolase n=1 Tax=Aquirhabdus sp. TaxID=2824160 RepID=UPI00396CE2CC
MNAQVKTSGHSSSAFKASFPVRRMDFEFADVPEFWAADDAGVTFFLTAMSALFPAGEQFFVDAVRSVRYEGALKDDLAMQKEISAFIGQEAMHSKEHHQFNAAGKAYGHDVDTLERWTDSVLGLADRFHLSNKLQLGITCALEHFTATIASELMRREDLHELMHSPVMYKMWLWHAVEETEHKSVAYNVYEKLYGKGVRAYATRASTMALAMVLLFLVHTTFMARLMAQRGKMRPSDWVPAMKMMYGGRKGLMSRIVPDLFDYFRPNFHPEQHDTTALLEKYKKLLNFEVH